jgi:hypothetical protein
MGEAVVVVLVLVLRRCRCRCCLLLRCRGCGMKAGASVLSCFSILRNSFGIFT